MKERSASRIDAFVAALVAVLALGVSGYTAYIQRQQVRAQVWPYLSIGFKNVPTLEFFVANKGVGPAIVQRVRLTVDGKAYRDWNGLLTALLGRAHHNFTYSQLSHRVFAPNESAATLTPMDDNRNPLPLGAASNTVRDALGRIGVDICYCSTLGDCWQLVDDAEFSLNEVSHCPTARADDFQQ